VLLDHLGKVADVLVSLLKQERQPLVFLLINKFPEGTKFVSNP